MHVVAAVIISAVQYEHSAGCRRIELHDRNAASHTDSVRRDGVGWDVGLVPTDIGLINIDGRMSI